MCGNYNTENVCLKCGRLKDSVYTDFFEWNVKITRHFKEAIESTNYFIGFFKFDITSINVWLYSLLFKSFNNSFSNSVRLDNVS